MELATVLIWTLRIVLPIILFCIYFKLQAPKEDGDYPGPTKNAHAKSRLLAQRRNVIGEPVPEEMRTIKLVTAAEEPSLFVARQPRTPGARGERREERPDKESRKDRGERDRPRRREQAAASAAPEAAKAAPESAAKAPEVEAAAGTSAPALTEAEEKMHLECLLNYVAFNRKEQQRTFLHDMSAAPPPPPKAPPPSKTPAAAAPAANVEAAETEAAGKAEEAPPTDTSDAAAKANAEAQMVLGGAIKFGCGDVATSLYEQLANQKVEVSSKTFEMMIESCVLSQDLKGASDFLMKMENSGLVPDSALLDKVMDLYSQQKHRRDEEKQQVSQFLPPSILNPQPTEPVHYGPVDADPSKLTRSLPAREVGGEAGPRLKLSSEASLFVPGSFASPGHFGSFQPPPPPGPPPSKANKAAGEQGNGAVPVDTNLPRTALKATSKSFTPQGNVSFNPYDHTWTVQTAPEEISGEAPKGGKGGKGKSKGKKGKGKDENADAKDSGGKAPSKWRQKA